MTSRPPSRIGFFLPDLNFGGVERITFELGRAIAERGTPVDLVLARAVGTASDAVPAVFRTVDLGATRTLSAIPPLSRYLRKEAPDALISAKDHSNVVAVIAQMVCRSPSSVIATVHSRPSETLGNPERWTGHAVRRVVPYAYSRAAGVVAVSQGVADDVSTIAPGARVRVIPNPVVTTELLSAGKRNPPHPWFARDRSFKTIVWCGRLAAAKDPFSAVDAIAELRHTVQARLVFVGDGPLRRELVQHVEQAGLEDAVDVVGYVEDPSPFIDKADALLFSSRKGRPPHRHRRSARAPHSGCRDRLRIGSAGDLGWGRPRDPRARRRCHANECGSGAHTHV